MSAQIEELTASAQTLARVSKQLRDHASRFVLSGGVATAEAFPSERSSRRPAA
jgi:hypothetical protein